MSPDERRAMIVDAALPLVAEYGAAVTTSRVAHAAGIGEATLFRVFADKNELLAACVAEAVRVDHLLAELTAIPPDAPLRDRLVQAAEALREHSARIGAVVGTLHASGHLHRQRRDEAGTDRRRESFRTVRAAIAELLGPDRSALRLPPEQLAGVLVGMLFLGRRLPGAEDETELSTPMLVDLFLHGALA
jgi:AcrR family transcriptional regulator